MFVWGADKKKFTICVRVFVAYLQQLLSYTLMGISTVYLFI